MSDQEIQKDLKEKQAVLNWMVKNNVNTVNAIGYVVSRYYLEPKEVLKVVRKGGRATDIIPKQYLEG